MRETCIRNIITITVITLLIILFVFRDTFFHIFDIWLTVGTYNHGLIILPVVFWLLWRNRSVLKQINIYPAYYPLLIIFVLLVLWNVSYQNNFNVGMHLAVFMILISMIWAIWGGDFIKSNLFAFVFLLFAVPVGDFMIPGLQKITADIVVSLLRVSGIPVYRESLYFYIPTGAFEVARACSGIRYLIASFTIGVLYSHLKFHTLWKRLLVVLISILIPLIANGIRAYIIVMIAHLSNMEYATGFDHVVYGWLFFGVVVFLLFYIGGYFEETASDAKRKSDVETGNQLCVFDRKSIVVVIMLYSLLLAHILFQNIS